MGRFSFALALLTLPCGVGMALGVDEIAQQKIVDTARENNQVVDHLDYLCNVIGPRLTASYNDHIACEWARDKFQEWGLSNVVMEKAGEFDVQFNRGPWSGKMLSPKEMNLEFGTAAWSAGTRGAVTALATRPPEDISTAKKEDYAGKWIVMESQGRRGNREQRTRMREQRDWLQDVGVAGFLYPSGEVRITTGGNSRISWDNLPTVPRINLLKGHWDEIAKSVDAGDEVQLRFDIRNHFKKGPVPYYNVIGDIIGTEFPDEYVVIGGHIDSWDGATGTTDNGMGTAIAMETARLLMESGIKPRRTIRFMLWSGEEQGLLGSRAWVDNNENLLDKVSCCIVYDGGPNPISGIKATAAMVEDFQEVFDIVQRLDSEMPFEIEEVSGLTMSPGSDHLSFLGKGVPGFFWEQKGPIDEWYGIHTQFDTFDLCVPKYLEHSAVVSALAAFGIADLDSLLSRESLRRAGGGRGGADVRRMGVYLDGTTIQEVIDGSVAAKCGMQAGDTIIKVGDTQIDDRGGLVRAVSEGYPRKVFIVKRGEETVELKLEWPDEIKKLEEEKNKKKRIVL